MKRFSIAVGIAAMAAVGSGTGVAVAQSVIDPNEQVMYEPAVNNINGESSFPSYFADGVTISEFQGAYMLGCGSGYVTGLVTTTRLGSRVVQELVVTDYYDPSLEGQSCSRAGDTGTDTWTDWRQNG